MKKFLLVLIVVLAVMQFFRIDKTNPPVDPQLDFITLNQPPEEVANLMRTSCYDCHGNTTEYPWYTNIAPVSWWIKGHIKNARARVNYSEWGKYTKQQQNNYLSEIAEVIEEKRMPAATYMIMHPPAKLSDAQRTTIVSWIASSTAP